MRARIRDDTGAEVLEFAIALPILLLLVFGLIFALTAVASQISLAHAASVGARYASIPTDMVHGDYPTDDQVVAKLEGASPFFDADDCTSVVTGAWSQNTELVLQVDCRLPNPLGGVLNKLTGSDSLGPTMTISARAAARRE